jgi:DNA-binding IclR family transcriptional regulator
MTSNAAEVFGVLRYCDQRELTLGEIAVRARKPWRAVAVALRDLQAIGLVIRRPSEDGTLRWSVSHQAMRSAAQARVQLR